MRTCIVAVTLLALVVMRVEAADVASAKDIVLGFYQDVFNKHDVSAIDRYAAEDIIDHNPDPGQKPGREGLKESFKQMFTTFPDVHVTTEQVLVDGDFVTVRSTISGTQEGEMMGMPASHRSFHVTLIDIVEVKDGKATQRWGLLDSASMMAQLSPPAEKTEH